MTRKLGHNSVDKFIYTDLLPVVVLSRTTDGLLIQLDLFLPSTTMVLIDTTFMIGIHLQECFYYILHCNSTSTQFEMEFISTTKLKVWGSQFSAQQVVLILDSNLPLVAEKSTPLLWSCSLSVFSGTLLLHVSPETLSLGFPETGLLVSNSETVFWQGVRVQR